MAWIRLETTRDDLGKSRKARMGGGIDATGPERELYSREPRRKSVDRNRKGKAQTSVAEELNGLEQKRCGIV